MLDPTMLPYRGDPTARSHLLRRGEPFRILAVTSPSAAWPRRLFAALNSSFPHERHELLHVTLTSLDAAACAPESMLARYGGATDVLILDGHAWPTSRMHYAKLFALGERLLRPTLDAMARRTLTSSSRRVRARPQPRPRPHPGLAKRAHPGAVCYGGRGVECSREAY